MGLLLRVIGYLVGAVCLLQLAIGIGGLLSLLTGNRLAGPVEVLVALASGIVLGALSVVLVRRSHPGMGTESESTR